MLKGKKGKKGNKKRYFAEKEEQGVIDYILTDSHEKKHTIYNDILKTPFQIMVEAILRRYQHHIGNYDIREVEANALSHLVEQFIKYRPFIVEYKTKKSDDNAKWTKSQADRFLLLKNAEKKILKLEEENPKNEYRIFSSKAYSYCQTIVRNFYKDHGEKSYKEKTQILSFDDYSEQVMEMEEYLYEIDANDKSDLEELIDVVVEEMRNRIDIDSSLKKNEIIVGEAIINVLSNWHVLFLEETPSGKINKKVTNKYQKNKVLHFLKELTGLNTKEIRLSMKPYKEIYFLEKSNFFNDDD